MPTSTDERLPGRGRNPHAPSPGRGAAIRQERLARGWSQAKLAEFLGVHHSRVSAWELGSVPGRASARKLHALFNLGLGMLLEDSP